MTDRPERYSLAQIERAFATYLSKMPNAAPNHWHSFYEHLLATRGRGGARPGSGWKKGRPRKKQECQHLNRMHGEQNDWCADCGYFPLERLK